MHGRIRLRRRSTELHWYARLQFMLAGAAARAPARWRTFMCAWTARIRVRAKILLCSHVHARVILRNVQHKCLHGLYFKTPHPVFAACNANCLQCDLDTMKCRAGGCAPQFYVDTWGNCHLIGAYRRVQLENTPALSGEQYSKRNDSRRLAA